jgi:peptidyl-prolyl cis-trans isomerase SurA
MRASLYRYTLIALALQLFWPGSAVPDVCNRIVAFVNSEVVTLFELEARMARMIGTPLDEFKARDPQGFNEARRQVLNLLIDEKIAQERIKELGISVTSKEVDQAIERVKEDNRWTQEDLMQRLKQQNLTYQEYREGIKTELERMRLINMEVKSKIIVRDEDIEAYFKARQEEFETPAKVRLSAIFIKSSAPSREGGRDAAEKASEIIKRIKAGEDFAELAKRYSQGPGAENGGDLGLFSISQLESELRELVTRLPEGGVSDPIVRAGGIQIIKVTAKERGGRRSLEDSKNAISNILYKEEVNRRYEAWLKELRKKAYTKVVF